MISLWTITPTLWNLEKLKRLLKSLENQSIKPQTILILDKKINHQEKQEFLYFLTKIAPKLNITFVNNLDFSNFKPWSWVSYVRNFGLDLVCKKSTDNGYLCLIDDDISLENKDIFQNILKYYEKEKNFFVFANVYNWYTKEFENAGILWISPWSLKVKINRFKKNIKMCSSQFLFGPINLFKKFKYDEKFKFVYEDLDFSRSISQSWYKIYVLPEIKVYHWDYKKNPAEKSYVSNPFLACQKWKNRILLVKKHFKWREKLIFYSIWWFIHTLRLTVLIIIWWKDKLKSIKNLIKCW